MEAAITGLSEAFETDPTWQETRQVLINNRTTIEIKLLATRRCFNYFAHQPDPNSDLLQALWGDLETTLGALYELLDMSGTSSLIGKLGPTFLQGFRYSEAYEFQAFERGLINDARIPDEAWHRFWAEIDERRDVFSRIYDRPEPLQLTSLIPEVAETFAEGLGTPEHLSPFNYWKATRVALAGVLSLADIAVAVHSVGLSIASTIPLVIMTTIDAGREAAPVRIAP